MNNAVTLTRFKYSNKSHKLEVRDLPQSPIALRSCASLLCFVNSLFCCITVITQTPDDPATVLNHTWFS